jgi:hypothetical protein
MGAVSPPSLPAQHREIFLLFEFPNRAISMRISFTNQIDISRNKSAQQVFLFTSDSLRETKKKEKVNTRDSNKSPNFVILLSFSMPIV